MTSSWFFFSTLNYDARSTTHQIYQYFCFPSLGSEQPHFSSPCLYSPTAKLLWPLIGGSVFLRNVHITYGSNTVSQPRRHILNTYHCNSLETCNKASHRYSQLSAAAPVVKSLPSRVHTAVHNRRMVELRYAALYSTRRTCAWLVINFPRCQPRRMWFSANVTFVQPNSWIIPLLCESTSIFFIAYNSHVIWINHIFNVR